MKHLRTLFAVLVLLCTAPALQAQDTGVIYGGLYNAFTREILRDAKVTLMRTDSSVVDSMVIDYDTYAQRTPAWYFEVPRQMEAHIVRFELEGYETCYLNVPAHHFKGRATMKLYDVFIHQKPREQKLGEATVTATKVKFLMKKDTLVFNADAFQLSEGSMLDALISQLPGVELKDDGRILVNGKQVESLLLNGEDFFKGNNRIMLDNLPSYTVNTVQVYEKRGDVGQMVGKNVGDEQYVMDVRLKRKYSIGWVGNAEVGYSTEENYLARLFAMRYTPQSRITLVGNVNNVNDNRRPGQDSEWTPEKMPSGLLTTRMGALDYLVKDKFKRFEVSGSLSANHSDANEVTQRAGETYLPQGNTFERSRSEARNHNVSVNTSHRFKFTPKDELMFIFRPYFDFSRKRTRSSYAGATFSSVPEGYGLPELIDSIRRTSLNGTMAQLITNRTLSQGLERERSYGGGISGNANITIMGIDILQIGAFMNATDTRYDKYDHYRLDYPSSGGETDFRNRWTKGHPNRETAYGANVGYLMWFFRELLFAPSYSFEQTHSHKDNMLYRLERAGEAWGDGTTKELGMLPSEVEQWQELTFDGTNSYERRQTDTEHTIKAYSECNHWFGENNNWFHYDIGLPVRLTHSRLDYVRHGGIYDGVTTRNTTFFDPSARIFYKWHGGERSVTLRYNLSHSSPDMLDYLGIEDNSDPLNIYNGNPGLKNTAVHSISFYHTNNSVRKQRYFSVNANATFRRNAKALAYTYDRSTGVKTYMPENVNGNYNLITGINYSMPLDKKKLLTFSTATVAQLNHGVDLISTESGVAPARSSVLTYWATETLKLDYRIGKVKAGVKAYGSWNRATSSREDFTPFTVWDFNYGPTVQVELPWNMQLATDLTIYSRRGYDDPSANTDDVVWNARLSKRALKGNLTFAVDAFDILGQLSNLTQTMNSQGRFETWRNVTPRYVMVHLIYKLHILPKKG